MRKCALKKESFQMLLNFTKEPKTRGAICDWIGKSSSTVSYMVKSLNDHGYLIETGTGKLFKYQATEKRLDDFNFALIKESMSKHRYAMQGTGSQNKETFDPESPIKKHVKSATSYVKGTNKGHMIVKRFNGFHSTRPSKSKTEVMRNNCTLNRI